MDYAQTASPRKGLFFSLFSNYTEARVEQFRLKIYGNTVRVLEKLSDQQLEDIGIPRSEIKQRAYQSVYHQMPYDHRVQ
ncbi:MULTISPECIES: DUF1127 domain-containing protein [unclassified Ruegeria]|uniref:DUF1127 domain-containing protein n=1 Tax=unclassified Ruegeria TaxID=2625375 RepID=UPI001ADAF74E|nr:MULTISPECIES: DUF1127 domain-containing protein [unclassified Ruegeria]MBO9413209.1 DUF1127 domain-containing protein [Ruegeria sp. R8_1]MBO9416807.1 DUF1127 domain-containing protein [Ruegeria sp. R8_2]